MAGIYSQGGSAGHRYAGWLSKVEAKNFQFGGKVFNGSPSAIYVGSNQVWPWLTIATQQAIRGAFGQRDGMAVINATNAYLNQLSASDMDKATALAGFINEDPMMVCSLGLSVEGVTMPIRWLVGDGEAYIKTGVMTGEDIELIWDMVLHTTSKTSSICGARISGNSNSISQGIDSQCWVSFGNNSEVYWSGIIAHQRYSIKQNKEGFWIDGVKHNYKSGYTTTFSTPLEMYLMGRNNNNQSVGNICDIDLDKMIINNGVTAVRQYYPFICQARTADKVSTGVAQAAGTCGMIDLLTGIFYPNANSSGTFTDAYTLQDGVTPWTPSTP